MSAVDGPAPGSSQIETCCSDPTREVSAGAMAVMSYHAETLHDDAPMLSGSRFPVNFVPPGLPVAVAGDARHLRRLAVGVNSTKLCVLSGAVIIERPGAAG